MAQRAAERVPGPQPVDHRDRHRRHLYDLRTVRGQHAGRALLDDRELDARVVQGAGSGPGLADADRSIALVQVADRDRRVRQCLGVPPPGLGPGRPEHRPVVQVEHGRPRYAVAGPQRLQRGAPARFLAQPGPRHPEDARAPDGVQVQFVRFNLKIRRGRETVEVQREVVRREDLAERHRGGQRRHGRHEAVVDAEPAQRVVDVVAERVLAGAADHGRPSAVTCRRDRDVGGAAAEVLAEALDVPQRPAGLQRVDVDPDAAHGQYLERLVGHHWLSCPVLLARSVLLTASVR